MGKPKTHCKRGHLLEGNTRIAIRKTRGGKTERSGCLICQKLRYQERREIIIERQKVWATKNPDRVNAYKKKSSEKNREKRRQLYAENRKTLNLRRRLYKYEITEEEYNRLWQSQNGRCAICNRHETELTRPLAVDHNHDTGKVRSLLCGNCNVGIGNLRDNPEIVRKALDYLLQHQLETELDSCGVVSA